MSKRILLIDDSPLVLKMVSQALARLGHVPLTASSFSELEAHVAQAPLDLLLIDVQMPAVFGDDVAKVLRMVRGVRTPIYLLSNLDEADLAARARVAAVEGYIHKSIGLGGIVDRVQRILAEQGA